MTAIPRLPIRLQRRSPAYHRGRQHCRRGIYRPPIGLCHRLLKEFTPQQLELHRDYIAGWRDAQRFLRRSRGVSVDDMLG